MTLRELKKIAAGATDPKVSAFLQEYVALCHQHGIFIDACGCCDGPWVSPAKKEHPDQLPSSIKHLVRIDNELAGLQGRKT